MGWSRLKKISLVVLALLCSCAKNGSQSMGQLQTEFSTVDETTPAFTFQIVAIDNTTHEVFSNVGQGSVTKGTNGYEWPAWMTSYLTQMKNGGTQVQFILKAYSLTSTGANGDFYFEAPILGSNVVMNGPSTALWLALKNSLANATTAGVSTPLPTLLSANTWQNALYLVNAQCSDCLQRPGGYTSHLIASNTALQNALNSFLALTGAGQLSTNELTSPPLDIALSNPPILSGAPSNPGSQGLSQTLQLIWADPFDLTTPVYPQNWGIDLNGSESDFAGTTGSPSQASWTFDFINTGSEPISAFATVRNTDFSATFPFTVSSSVEAPTFPPLTINYQANHLLLYDISSNAYDPRGENLTYELVSGPSGLTLSGSTLHWNPTQVPSQIGANAIIVLITNTDQQSVLGTINGQVILDNYPAFSGTQPTTWSLAEGTTGTLVLDAQDLDGDPIEVTCISGCSSFVSGSPTGAGWPSNLTYPNASIYTTNSGIEQISIPFMPSYLQVLSAGPTAGPNQVDNITLKINYPAGSLVLRQVASPATTNVSLSIQNIADPPVWITQPGPSPSPVPTELIPISPFPGGAAQDPAYNPGHTTPLVYTIDNLYGSPGSAADCSWLTLNASTAQFTGTPPYSSSGTCGFQVRATDSLGLYADSSSFAIAIVDVPRPMGSPSAVPSQSATEGVQYTLNLDTFVNDPDLSVSDPRDSLTFSCTNCASLGIPMGSPGNTLNEAYLNGPVFTWTPGYAIAPTGSSTTFTGINILITKNEYTTSPGHQYNLTFNLTVHDAPTNLKMSFINDSLTINTTPTPNSCSITPSPTGGSVSGTVELSVTNLAGDASDYPYTIALTCNPNCTVESPVSISSSAVPGTFPITITVADSDGYGGPSATQNVLALSATLTPTPYPSLAVSANLNVDVQTVDRALTALVVNGDTGTGTYSLPAINGTVFSNNTANLGALSPDSSNDTFTYTFDSSKPSFGTISGSSWSFNPIDTNCIQSGATPFTANFAIRATSSHGPYIVRNVTVNLTNSKNPGTGATCP
jgi:hypothetical protein